MISIKVFSPSSPPSNQECKDIAYFLYTHLEEFGDPLADIQKAIDYALDDTISKGGLIVTSRRGTVLTGAVVVNRTGMKGYIPENILVYIATHNEYRGCGIGRQLMTTTIEHVEGDIALHVEPDNSAKRLYESLGFTNKYLEMRLKK